MNSLNNAKSREVMLPYLYPFLMLSLGGLFQSASASPNRCLPDGPPAIIAQPAVTTGDCRPFDEDMAQELTTRFNRMLGPKDSANYKWAVSLDCDPLADPPKTIVYETGSGHGQSLTLWRFTQSTDGLSYNIHGLVCLV